MAKKLSSNAQQELDVILEARRKLDRIHGLVEQYATATKGQDHFAGLISRAATELGRTLLLKGFGVMADQANQMATWAKRGGATQTKFRGLRDFVSSLRPALDRAEKAIYERDASGAGEP